MNLTIILPVGRCRTWMLRLIERLEAADHAVTVSFHIARSQWPDEFTRLAAFERRLYRMPPEGAHTLLPKDTFTLWVNRAPVVSDVTIDLAGIPEALPGPVLRLLFDGYADEAAALGAVLAGRTPAIAVALSNPDTIIASGRPAIEDRRALSRALDYVFARCEDLLAVAVLDLTRRVDGEIRHGGAPAVGWPTCAAYVLTSVANGVRRRLDQLRGVDLTWGIGWFPSGDAPLMRGWPADGMTIMPMPADRFYADPFVLQRDGRLHVFFEDYPIAQEKGLISVASLDNGRTGEPRLVLDLECHLSYPFVFEHGGELWMIPETSGRRTVELYRCHGFPDTWRLEGVMLSDVSLADVTLVEHEGRWWMFAASAHGDSSTWDALSLYHGPSPMGPWTPHAANPVLIDAGGARPGGCMTVVDGQLYRHAQICETGYGEGLALCRVDRLNPDEPYAQTVVERIKPPARSGLAGLHTATLAGGFTFVDLYGQRSALSGVVR